MGFDTIIANGKVVTATDTYLADIAISAGKIEVVGQNLPRQNAARVLEAMGKYVFPGGIDVHTHLDMPFGGTTSADDFETGTRAAAFGGTTTLIDFAIQYKGQSLRTAFDTWMSKASQKAVCDYSFHCIVTDLGGTQLEEMNALVGEGVTSFKLFMAYPGVFMLDDASIFKALQTTAKNGGLVCMHAENGSAIDVIVQQALAEGKRAPKYHALTRPTTAEAEATSRAIALAEMAGAPVYIVHLSCNEALEKVREARDRGLPAYAETCPQYLYLSLENMDAPGFEGAKYVFTPPLREKWHQEKLWQGLAKDTLQLVSTAPAKLFGLYPRKGTITVGSDADLVIFDPHHEEVISAKTHHMRVDYSMFEGIRTKGAAKTVFSRGRAVIDAGQFVGRPGAGQFLRRQTYAGL